MSNELKDLVEKIQYVTKLTRAEIAERAGYTREYLSMAIKKQTKGKIIDTLQKEFEKELHNNADTLERTGTVVDEINKLMEKIIQLQASMEVYGSTIEHIAADVKGLPLVTMKQHLDAAILSAKLQLIDEWKKGL